MHREEGMDKVLIFTHGIDIDGYGCAVLGKLAFDNPEICFAENFNLDELFQERWNSGELEKYDQIFITDHCLTYSKCQEVDKCKILRNKLMILDHHKARFPQNDFDFVKVVEQENGKNVCGTSLFYDYLVERGLLQKSSALDRFVELTRSYDTWDWTKNGEVQANELNTLALAVGREKYILNMQNKLLNEKEFEFSPDDKLSITNFQIWFRSQLTNLVNKVEVIKYDGFNAGYVETVELFKNDIALAIRKSKRAKDIDFMLMPITDRGTVSLRSVKEDFDVNAIAQNHGGGGHPGAASFPMSNLFIKESEQ